MFGGMDQGINRGPSLPAEGRVSVRQLMTIRAKTASVGNRLERILAWVSSESNKEGAYLLPMRLFIGFGWLRALSEKLINPAWFDGAAVSTFLQVQRASNHVVFPAYAWLISNVFLPHAMVLGWIILLGQLMVGLSLIFGAFSRAGLLGGLFMNLNFIAAGVVSPSVFYLVIQLVLLLANAGRTFGLDVLGYRRNIWHALLEPQTTALSKRRTQFRISRHALLGLAVVCAGLAFWALVFARDFSPKGSISDPAIILSVSGFYAAGHFLIRAIRAFSMHVG